MTVAIDAKALYTACLAVNEQVRAPALDQVRSLLYRVASSRMQKRPELHYLADECTQEAMITIWRNLEAGRGPDSPESFVSWAVSIVIHKLLDELRKLGFGSQTVNPRRAPLSAQVRLRPDDDADDADTSLIERTAAPLAAGPEDLIAYKELCDLLSSIRDLPDVSEDSKTVLLRGFLADWNDDDLATALKTPRANVHTIRCRDLKKLRDNPVFMERLRMFRS